MKQNKLKIYIRIYELSYETAGTDRTQHNIVNEQESNEYI